MTADTLLSYLRRRDPKYHHGLQVLQPPPGVISQEPAHFTANAVCSNHQIEDAHTSPRLPTIELQRDLLQVTLLSTPAQTASAAASTHGDEPVAPLHCARKQARVQYLPQALARQVPVSAPRILALLLGLQARPETAQDAAVAVKDVVHAAALYILSLHLGEQSQALEGR